MEKKEENEPNEIPWKNAPTVTVWRPKVKDKREIKKSWRFQEKKQVVGELETEIITKGRHDPCVGIRAAPVGEAMMALVIADHYIRNRGQTGKE